MRIAGVSCVFLLLIANDLCSLTTAVGFSCENSTWLHEKVCLPLNHNKLALPSELVNVSISVRDAQVLTVNNEAETITMKMTLVFRWVEPALITYKNREEGDPGVATLDQTVISTIWNPDLWISEVVSFDQIELLNPMSALIARVDSKEITYMTAVIIEFYCHMQFDEFPFDEQDCNLYLQSTNHAKHELVFTSEFDQKTSKKGLEAFKVTYGNIPDEDKWIPLGPPGVIFSQAGIKLHLERRYFSFILRYYVPCFGLTAVSWVGFVIPPDAIPGRTGLLTTLFLVLTTMFIGIQVII